MKNTTLGSTAASSTQNKSWEGGSLEAFIFDHIYQFDSIRFINKIQTHVLTQKLRNLARIMCTDKNG